MAAVNTLRKRDNSGALFRNKNKQRDTHPDFNGTAVIDGREYYIAGWARESANGKRYTSLAFKLKPPQPTVVPLTRQQPRDEELPP